MDGKTKSGQTEGKKDKVGFTLQKGLWKWHWVEGSEEKWYGSASLTQKGQRNRTADKMAQQFKETGQPVFKGVSFSRGVLKRKKWKNHHSLQRRFYKHRTLVPNNSFCKSAQCLHCRSELVCTSWLDRGRERTSQFVCGQKGIDKCTTWRSTTFGISSDKGICKQFARKHFDLRSTVQQNPVLTAMWKSSLSTSCFRRDEVFKFDLTRTTGGKALFLSVGNTQFLELILNLESLQQFLEEQLLDQLLKFESWKFLKDMGSSFNSIDSQSQRDILRCDLQRNKAFCGWNPWPQKGVQIQ